MKELKGCRNEKNNGKMRAYEKSPSGNRGRQKTGIFWMKNKAFPTWYGDEEIQGAVETLLPDEHQRQGTVIGGDVTWTSGKSSLK